MNFMMDKIVPPPWTLRGRGFVLVYRFERHWALEHGFIPESRYSSFIGGFGAVMLVDYLESNCGPYRELLLVPGRFRLNNGSVHYAVTKIYVSTKMSVDSGIANWGIPKELADFAWDSNAGQDQIKVLKGGQTVLEARFSSDGLGVPVNTNWLPAAWLTLAQPELEPDLTPRDRGQILLTAPSAAGAMRLARIQQLCADPHHFPNLESLKPWLVVKANPFTMQFPIPRRTS
jgi:hypothetical protein